MAVAAAVAPRPGAAAIAPDSGENPLLSAERDDCNETPDVVVCDGRSVGLFLPTCLRGLKSFNFFFKFLRKDFCEGHFIEG